MAEPARRSLSEMAGDFLSQRRQDLERFAADAQAAEQQGYDIAAKAGQYLLRPELAGLDLGFRIVGGGLGPAAAKRQQIATKRQAPPRPAPRRPVSRPAKSPPQQSWLDRSVVAKTLGGDAARTAGWVPGIARSALHTAEGLKDATFFAGRLLNPVDAALSEPGEGAWDAVVDAGKGFAGYAGSRLSHPAMAVNDVKNGFHQFRLRTDPSATPPADTFMGEVKRNFDIGLNQGETAGDVASLFYGGAELKPLSKFGKFSREAQEAKFLARGYPPEIARDFAKPYSGMGHHYWPRREPLPAFLGGKKLPPVLSESPFFLLRPKGLSKGEMYELHYQVDPIYGGGKIPGGARWRGEDLGWKKLGRPGRIWYGMPKPLKATMVGPVMAASAADFAHDNEGMR